MNTFPIPNGLSCGEFLIGIAICVAIVAAIQACKKNDGPEPPY